MRSQTDNPKKNRTHPVIDYVNEVNRKISASAKEFCNKTNFYVTDDHGVLISDKTKEETLKFIKHSKLYTRDELSIHERHTLVAEMAAGKDEITSGPLKIKRNNDLIFSASIMHLLGFDEEVNSLLEVAFCHEKFILGQIHFVYNSSKVFERLKQKKNSSKPRNPNYALAIKIIKDTWAKYPEASKNEMCSKLHLYFNGTVSKDTLKRWIKKSKLQPPKPLKYSSFSLVVNSD